MNIRCPHCQFSKDIDPSKAPSRPTRVTCPKCRQVFTFDPAASNGSAAPAASAKQIRCPACGLQQDEGLSCQGCGIVYEKWQRRQAEMAESRSLDADLGYPQEDTEPSPAELPKAGFWIRVVSFIIDSILVTVVQMILGFILGMAVGIVGGELSDNGHVMIGVTTWMFGMILSWAYYVFFTGYCGQTPGKMALRIKVIRTDGSPLGYGSAFLREVIGKFISGILLGIGYLMVAFDGQKQGLHDKIAGTYVIKL